MSQDHVSKRTGGIIPLSIEKELKTSFLDYAMSVIVSRALPDVRDGLKPVHRRILYSMHRLGYYHDKQPRKSANVSGDVMAHYHPHGDAPIYQAMVGLVQDFSKRYPLIDGQGNWGSIDGDNAASSRYTEVRMARITQELLVDIEKETVDFVPNYDESTKEPILLPSRIPVLLLNGANGIAVGMATSIPPHNLNEVMKACIALVENPHLSEEELFSLIPAPDFPTGGIICGRGGIIKAYRTGHGSVTVRGVVAIEETDKKNQLVITEIPYQVNKADLIKKIADLVKAKVVEGISNIRDESNRTGIRVVIELKRGESPEIVLNQLYKHTQLQTNISMLLLAVHNNRPQVFTLRQILDHFIEHRREVITRRTEFELRRQKAKAHILEGLMRALDHIDAIIALIRGSQTAEEAYTGLCEQFGFSELQAKAILDMRLQKLTGLEREKLASELTSIHAFIVQLTELLENPHILDKEMVTEFTHILTTYGDARRTTIENAISSLSEADLIPDEEVVITLTRRGYIKRVILDTYSLQRRGGKGKRGMADLDDSDDIMQDLFVTKNHDDLLFFTNLGRVYSLKVFQIPEASRIAKGRAIINLLPLGEGEHVVKLLCSRDLDDKYLVLCTKLGTIKKTAASEFAKIRSTGIRAVTLNEGDELAFCGLSTGDNGIVMVTQQGQGIHFKEEEVRAMGRQAAGVRGIRLKENDEVVGFVLVTSTDELLVATSKAYGKRVRISDFRIAHRGGMGVRTIPASSRNGVVVGVVVVSDNSQILLIDRNGKIVRISPKEVRTMGRQAQGVRLVKLDKDQILSGIAAFEESEEEAMHTEIPEIQETEA